MNSSIIFFTKSKPCCQNSSFETSIPESCSKCSGFREPPEDNINAEPARRGLQRRRTSAGSRKLAFAAGTRHVFTLGDDRSGSLLERAAHCSDRHDAGAARAPTTSPPSSTPAAPPGAARARCSRTATCSSNARGAEGLLGLAAQRRRADPRAADLPCARPLRRLARRAAQRQQDALVRPLRPAARWSRGCRDATVFMGVPTLYVRLLAEPGADARGVRATCASSSAARRRC